MTIAFQGECGAFSELAAIEFFGDKQRPVAVAQWEDVFMAVENNAAKYGIIPIENSLGGSIHRNYDLLLHHKPYIVGELYLKISQQLLANKGVLLSHVKRIYSHPQGFEQCWQYLQHKMPGIQLIPISNTAAAAKKIKEEALMNAAAISSTQAAIDYDLKILAKNIEDNKENITRFLILGNKENKQASTKPMKTSVVFSLKNVPGALFRALSVFSLRDIDLVKIESRPVRGKPFEYLFYLDFGGNYSELHQQNALNHLQEITVFYRVLGTYEVGRLAIPHYKKR